MRLTLTLFLLVSLSLARLETKISPQAFFQYNKKFDNGSSLQLMGSELNIHSTLSNQDRDILALALQAYIWGTMTGWAKKMHYGNAYVIFPLGLGRPNIKLGQQVLPFGLLADYDTHGQIVQTPYVRTIGLRIDPGISVNGLLGSFNWWYMVSNGAGPNVMDLDENKVQTLRISANHAGTWADALIGISFLRGILPDFSENPLVDMMATPDSFLIKNRIALDFEFSPPQFLIRAELVGGNQEKKISRFNGITKITTFSGYMELRIPLIYNLELMAKYALFKPATNQAGSTRDLMIGVNYIPAEINAFNIQLGGFKYEVNEISSYSLVAQLAVTL